MRRLNEYVPAGDRLLRCGYTTGTCAAAATRAAAELLLAGIAPDAVAISTPAGVQVIAEVEGTELTGDYACCAVRKDAGDDADVTDGILVYARVRRSQQGGVTIRGGAGVGVVTKPGLDQPPGNAAINTVPRTMIRKEATSAAQAHDYAGGLDVEICIPAGEELAQRTFNPRLGIEGGISVLGTTGIVRPMSEDALVESIRLELRVLRAQGAQLVLVVPGNYGMAFAHDVLGLNTGSTVTCSNYVGPTLDEASRLGFTSLLFVGHIGKMAKVAGGAMNTHSRVTDGRAEVIATHAALAGASAQTVRSIMEAPTTERMVDLLAQEGLLKNAMATLIQRLGAHLNQRAGNGMRVEAVVFSQTHGMLGATDSADKLMAAFANTQQALGKDHLATSRPKEQER